jgi:HK97 family phage major capsid protein
MLTRDTAPFPGWPSVGGGSTPPPPALGAPPVPMTQAELRALISDTAREALAPAVTAALEPWTRAQGDVMERIVRALPGTAPESTTFDDKILGPYPIGRKIRALGMASLVGHDGDPDAASLAIRNAIGWPAKVAEPTLKWLAHVKTTLTAGTAATAGDMILPQYDTEWIALLRNNAVVRSIARTIPMPRGATSRRKQTGSATAYYQGETDKMIPSNLSVGRVSLSYKKLTALSVISNDLIRFSAGEADRMVEEDFLLVVGLREDRAFLVGNPPTDAGSPQGIRFQTAAANVFANTGVTLAAFQADLTSAISKVQASNVPATPANSYFLISASTFWKIYALATTTGDMIFASMLNATSPNLFGFPVRITTQLEVTNSWIGANGGMIIFCHAPSLEIHDSMARTVATYVGGAYYDPILAAVASGISNDETVVTCISEHDFLQVYDTAAAVITGYAT